MKLFDEWGSFVGDYIPAGGGSDSCLMTIAMIIAFGFFFIVYLIIKAIVLYIKSGIKYAKEGKTGEAIAVFGSIILVLLIIAGIAAASHARDVQARANWNAIEDAKEAAWQSKLDLEQEFTKNPPVTIEAWREPCPVNICEGDDVGKIIIHGTVTNNWNGPNVDVWGNKSGFTMSKPDAWYESPSYDFEYGKPVEFYSSPLPSWYFDPERKDDQEVCFNILIQLDPHSGFCVSTTVCKDVP